MHGRLEKGRFKHAHSSDCSRRSDIAVSCRIGRGHDFKWGWKRPNRNERLLAGRKDWLRRTRSLPLRNSLGLWTIWSMRVRFVWLRSTIRCSLRPSLWLSSIWLSVLTALPPEQTGWLAGLRDPSIGKALSLLHGWPAQNWTIEELAKQVGQSRLILAGRFTDLVGVPPMQYLAKWRMQIASDLLTSGEANVATIAAEIGYASEAAFSRAFKKMVGVSPSVWRRRRD